MSEANNLHSCPTCGESIQKSAILCRFCNAGLSLAHFNACQFCGEMVRKEATFCRYCRQDLANGVSSTQLLGQAWGAFQPPKTGCLSDVPAPRSHGGHLFNLSEDDIDRIFSDMQPKRRKDVPRNPHIIREY
jgi:ribosomal protein L32